MQMKHLTQKLFGLLSVLVLAAGTSHAAFTSKSVVTKSATASLTGTGVVSLTVTAKNMSNNATTTDISWTGVTLPTAWKSADQYLQLDTNITDATGGVRIVTDNKGAGANPAYTGPNNTAAGLVDNVNHANALPLAWTIKDAVISTGPVAAKPFESAAVDGAGSPAQFQWLYMTDLADTAVAAGAPYRTAVNSTGIHFGGSDTEFGAAASPNFVYLEANFANAVTPRTYSTNKLIVEAFTQ
jgi:hypothetical protein